MKEIKTTMEQQENKDEKRLFDQVHTECCQCRLARRRVSEAMRRVRDWFNKELAPPEVLPKEFKDINQSLERERMRDLWNRFL
jgi:hypothetical protein